MISSGVYVCFVNRASGERSDVLGPFASVELGMFSSVEVVHANGSMETIAFREEGRWVFQAREFEHVLFVPAPDCDAINEIASENGL